jgi:hypothetical protein
MICALCREISPQVSGAELFRRGAACVRVSRRRRVDEAGWKSLGTRSAVSPPRPEGRFPENRVNNREFFSFQIFSFYGPSFDPSKARQVLMFNYIIIVRLFGGSAQNYSRMASATQALIRHPTPKRRSGQACRGHPMCAGRGALFRSRIREPKVRNEELADAVFCSSWWRNPLAPPWELGHWELGVMWK